MRRPYKTHMKYLYLCIFIFIPLKSIHAETIYLTPQEALKITFQNSQEIVAEKKILTPEQMQVAEKKLGQPINKNTWNFYLAKTGAQVDGYAVIDNEMGKMEPITFMTAINPDGTIKSVELLVYRETHGQEVHERNFLKQYKGKKNSDPLRVGQDIKNITGATISSHAVTYGVKRDLLIWNLFYGK